MGAVGHDERRFTRQGQERKQQLLDEAARLFAERGYADTRVIDICRAAGVAKGLFYWYFENKEALFRELVESTRQGMRRAQGAAIDAGADPLTRIRQGVEASVRFMAEHHQLYSMILIESSDQRIVELLRNGGDIHAADTARHLREAIDAGLVRDEDPLTLAWSVVAMVSNMSLLLRTGRLMLPIDEVAAFTARFVVRALAASDEVAAAVEAGQSPLLATV